MSTDQPQRPLEDDNLAAPRIDPRLAEREKPPLDISLFELFQNAFSSRLTPLRATKVTLVDISHSLEELVIADRLPAMVFTGFQESSYWRKEAARYLAMAGIAHSISIFAGGMPPEAPNSNYIHVKLSYQDTLRQEWFLVVLTHHFSALLCGRDRLEEVTEEAERAFDTLWTFEPDLISDLVLLLARVIEHYRPERHAALLEGLKNFPPLQPDARYVTLLTARVVNHLERQYSAQRQRLSGGTGDQKSLVEVGQEIDTALLPLLSNSYLLMLLGVLTYDRVEQLSSKVVADLITFKAGGLFIDMSKVTAIEPAAALRLIRMTRELGMCGVKAALTGLHPAVAAIFVEHNLDAPGLSSYTNLEEALKHYVQAR